MKRPMLLAALVALALLAVPAALAGDAAKTDGTTTVTGWITDANCGAKNANAGGKACALSCYKNGARLVLYSPGDKKTYDLDQQETASKNVGFEVAVTGAVQDGKIKVTAIEPAKKG